MTTDFEKAKALLGKGKYTIVIVKKEHIITSTERGVKPLLQLLKSNIDYSEYSASDKVIGKAAAFLYILLGIKNIHCKVMSRLALGVFEKFGINPEYDSLVDNINNRTNTDWCPMEKSVKDIDCPEIALKAIIDKIEELSQK